MTFKKYITTSQKTTDRNNVIDISFMVTEKVQLVMKIMTLVAMAANCSQVKM